MAIIPSQPLAHRIWELHEVLQTSLAPSLEDEDLLCLRETCRLLRDSFEDNFQRLRTQIFTERNGARARCEEHIPLNAQIEKAKRISALHKQLKKTSDPWLVFDQEGIPQIVRYKDHFSGKPTSDWELLKAKYQFYRCNSLKDRDDQLETLFDFQDKIISDFDQKPLDRAHPLQDLRDRMRRVQKLHKERTLLQTALKLSHASFFKSLSLIEKVFFFVISFFHSLFQKSSSGIVIPSLASKRLRANRIQLAETTIVHNTQQITLLISAKLDYSNGELADAMNVCIESKNGANTPQHFRPTYFKIRREWGIENNHYFSEDDFDSKKEIGSLRDRRLHIVIFPDRLGQDPITGDKPILRLITQIAVEIFQRESETKLVMTYSQGDPDVFVAGGFKTPSKSALRETKTQGGLPFPPILKEFPRQHYIEAIIEARNQGKVFPSRDWMGSFDVQLEKLFSSYYLGTQFGTNHKEIPVNIPVVMKDNQIIELAYVDFTLNAAPLTWEEQIEHHWILPPSKDPILPKFFTKKLDRFERSQPAKS